MVQAKKILVRYIPADIIKTKEITEVSNHTKEEDTAYSETKMATGSYAEVAKYLSH